MGCWIFWPATGYYKSCLSVKIWFFYAFCQFLCQNGLKRKKKVSNILWNWYVLTSIWVLRTPNAGQNHIFRYKKLQKTGKDKKLLQFNQRVRPALILCSEFLGGIKKWDQKFENILQRDWESERLRTTGCSRWCRVKMSFRSVSLNTFGTNN